TTNHDDAIMKNPWTALPFRLPALALAAAALPAGALAQSDPELAAQVKALRDELRQVRAELDAMKKQQQPAPAAAATGWDAAPGAGTASAPAGSQQAAAEGRSDSGSGVSLFGYGELNYIRPTRDLPATTATAARAVFGFGYRFNERTRFAAEL